MGEAEIRAELVALLAYANKSEIARALRVTPQAVINWSKGRNTSQRRLEQIRSLYGLGTQKEAPPPDWAEGLASRVADSVVERVVSELLGAPDSPLALLPELYDTLVGELPPDEPLPEGAEASPGVGGTARQPVRSRRGKA